MKIKFLTFLSLLLLVACNKEFDGNDLGTDDYESTVATQVNGQIPGDIGLYDIVLHAHNHSWKDLDAYYRMEVLLTHANTDYFKNLKNVVYWHLVTQFKMLEDADVEVIEYYVNEQLETELIVNIDIFLMSLDKLEGVWSDKQLADAALNRYHKNVDYIDNNFQDPKAYYEKVVYDLNKLTKYASGKSN